MFRAELERNPHFLRETIELFQKLHKKHWLAVVSSSNRADVEPLLERAGIRECFEALVCGTEAQNLKPAPDPYLLEI